MVKSIDFVSLTVIFTTVADEEIDAIIVRLIIGVRLDEVESLGDTCDDPEIEYEDNGVGETESVADRDVDALLEGLGDKLALPETERDILDETLSSALIE